MSKLLLKRLASVALTAATIVSTSHVALANENDGQVPTAAADVKHVFVIVLENKSFSDTFGTSTQEDRKSVV